MTQSILTLKGSALRQDVFPLSAAQARADALVSSFVDHATDGYSLAAMVGGGLVYRLGRVGTLAIGSRFVEASRWLALPVGHVTAVPLRALSIGVGFTGEVFTFEAGQRALRVGIGGADPNLLRWSGENGLGRGLVGAAITLGSLKGTGAFVNGQNPVLQHLFQDSAMVLAHNVSDRIFSSRGTLQRAPTLVEQFVEAEATLWQMNAGMSLVHGAFPGLGQVERSLDLSVRSGVGAGIPPPSMERHLRARRPAPLQILTDPLPAIGFPSFLQMSAPEEPSGGSAGTRFSRLQARVSDLLPRVQGGDADACREFQSLDLKIAHLLALKGRPDALHLLETLYDKGHPEALKYLVELVPRYAVGEVLLARLGDPRARKFVSQMALAALADEAGDSLSPEHLESLEALFSLWKMRHPQAEATLQSLFEGNAAVAAEMIRLARDPGFHAQSFAESRVASFSLRALEEAGKDKNHPSHREAIEALVNLLEDEIPNPAATQALVEVAQTARGSLLSIINANRIAMQRLWEQTREADKVACFLLADLAREKPKSLTLLLQKLEEWGIPSIPTLRQVRDPAVALVRNRLSDPEKVRPTQEWILQKDGRYVIGRAPAGENTIRLSDRRISRTQAALVKKGKRYGIVSLAAGKSAPSHGVWLEITPGIWRRLIPELEYPLKKRGRFAFGQVSSTSGLDEAVVFTVKRGKLITNNELFDQSASDRTVREAHPAKHYRYIGYSRPLAWLGTISGIQFGKLPITVHILSTPSPISGSVPAELAHRLILALKAFITAAPETENPLRGRLAERLWGTEWFNWSYYVEDGPAQLAAMLKADKTLLKLEFHEGDRVVQTLQDPSFLEYEDESPPVTARSGIPADSKTPTEPVKPIEPSASPVSVAKPIMPTDSRGDSEATTQRSPGVETKK